MCGRTALTAPAEDLRKAFGLDETPSFEPHYNVPPSQPLNVVRVLRGSTGRRLGVVALGTRSIQGPTSRKSLKSSPLARVETVTTSPAFRDAIRKRRCLVAVDGLFEWMREGKRTGRPFLVRREDGKPFALRGRLGALGLERR